MVNVGDRVSIDSLKVGQPRRTGVVRRITEGLSGVRYEVEWDDGHSSFFSPSGGNLIVERGGRPAPRATRGASDGARSAPRGSGARASTPRAAAKRGKSPAPRSGAKRGRGRR